MPVINFFSRKTGTRLSLLPIAIVLMNAVLCISCRSTNNKTEISKEFFGVMPDGDSVFRYTLANKNGEEIKVLNYGGIIQSWDVPGKDGKSGSVVLGFDSLGQYISQSPYFGALIGRFANRIARGTFKLNDSVYHLYINDGLNALHGGKTGFDKRIWAVEPFVTDTTEGLHLHYVSKDGEEGYPGNLDVKVTYTLNDRNEFRIDYEAQTDKPTIINLANHTYFNLSGGKKNILNEELMLDADTFLPVDSTSIPTGEVRNVSGTPMDFRTPVAVGARINDDYPQLKIVKGGYDHNWILNTKGDLKQVAASVYDPDNGKFLQIFTTQPGIQFYSGNFLDSTLHGSNGNIYPKHSAIVLETQHYPDSPNQPSFPSVVLNPGDTFQSSTIYKFSVK